MKIQDLTKRRTAFLAGYSLSFKYLLGCVSRAVCTPADKAYKGIDNALESFGLRTHLFRCGGALFGIGGGLLGHLVHFRHSPVDLFDPLCLFLGGRRDLAHQVARLSHDLRILIEGLIDIFIETFSFLDRIHRVSDQVARVLGRLGRPHGECTYLIGHDGKSCSRLSGPGRLDSRIEGKEVRLKGDFIDCLDNLRGFLGIFTDVAHCRGHPRQFFADVGRHLFCLIRQYVRLVGVIGILLCH